jgi:hypothetical protein
MTASLTSPAQIVNAALVRIGWKQRIGNLYDGSAAARVALDVYGQTRDELLRKFNPDFSMRNVALTFLKAAPVDGGYPVAWDPTVNPPVGWLFEYVYPSDCLKVRSVKSRPVIWPNIDPADNPFSIDNDPFIPDGMGGFTTQRVILCNVKQALLVYTGRVTDPTTFDVSFEEEFIDELGLRLGPGLTGLETTKIAAAEGVASAKVVALSEG